MRVVFDVNIFVRAALGSPTVAGILSDVLRHHATVLINDVLVDELAGAVRKPRIVQHVDWGAYNDLLSFLSLCGTNIDIRPPFPPCRDTDDAYLLAIAEAGRADNLVTNDDDLLCLKIHGHCRIVTSQEFASLLATL